MSMRYLIMIEQLIHYKYTNSTERIPHTTPDAKKTKTTYSTKIIEEKRKEKGVSHAQPQPKANDAKIYPK